MGRNAPERVSGWKIGCRNAVPFRLDNGPDDLRQDGAAHCQHYERLIAVVSDCRHFLSMLLNRWNIRT